MEELFTNLTNPPSHPLPPLSFKERTALKGLPPNMGIGNFSETFEWVLI
jgi:hypothetical protein